MSFSKFYKGSLINELFDTDIPVEWDKELLSNGLILGSFTAPNGRVFVIELNRGSDPDGPYGGVEKEHYLNLCEYNEVEPIQEVLKGIGNNTLWEVSFIDAKQEHLSNNARSTDTKTGSDILGTGNASFVFSAVIHGLMDITLDVPSIKVLSFHGHNVSRISLYNKLVRTIGQSLGWNYQELKDEGLEDLSSWYLYR